MGKIVITWNVFCEDNWPMSPIIWPTLGSSWTMKMPMLNLIFYLKYFLEKFLFLSNKDCPLRFQKTRRLFGYETNLNALKTPEKSPRGPFLPIYCN